MSTSSPYSKREQRQGPVLRVTRYDRASAFVIAAVLGLLLTLGLLLAAWAAQHEWRDDSTIPLELIDVGGGVEDGSESETLELETPFEEMPDPSLAEIRDDQTQVEPMLDSVLDLANQATDMAQQQIATEMANTGRPGSRSGTGNAALGMGSGERGLPREQRWFVRFDEGGTSQSYARQLDAFGIELGALLPSGELVYLSNMSSKSPNVRRVDSGAGEDRLYFTWQGGGRRGADLEIFRQASVDIGSAPMFHFYPKETENQLAQLEAKYRGRPAQDIRRTYFSVAPKGSGYEFVVTRQAYFR